MSSAVPKRTSRVGAGSHWPFDNSARSPHSDSSCKSFLQFSSRRVASEVQRGCEIQQPQDVDWMNTVRERPRTTPQQGAVFGDLVAGFAAGQFARKDRVRLDLGDGRAVASCDRPPCKIDPIAEFAIEGLF